MTESLQAAAAPPGFEHHHTDLGELTMHYVSGGEGPVVVLLHGWPQTWYEWRDVLPALADHGYHVIAPDLRGLGDSTRPEGGYDATMAEDLHRLLTGLGHSSVALVGHDWGAAIAYAYAAQFRDAVTHLAMVEGIPFGPWVTQEPQWSAAPASDNYWFLRFHQIPDLPELLTTGREREYLSYFYRHSAADPDRFSAAAVDEYVRTYRQPSAMRAGFSLYRTIPADVEDNLRFAETPLEMPVLALGGALSFNEVVISVMRQLATDVTGGVIPDARHWIAEEQTDVLLDHLVALLGRTPDRRVP